MGKLCLSHYLCVNQKKGIMQAILLDTDSKSDLKLLMEIAKKIGIKART